MSFVIDNLQELELPADSFVVVGSGILDVLNIRRANDVDIIVNEQLYKNLEKRGWGKIKKPSGSALKNGFFEAGTSWDATNDSPNFKELFKTSVVVEDFHFVSLERLLEWKKKKARPKDLKDVELIKKYLKIDH